MHCAAILSDPLMAVSVDLVTDANAAHGLARLPRAVITADDLERFATGSKLYLQALCLEASHYSKRSIQAGKDARHLWFALRDWRGENTEDSFGDFGGWAENRMREFAVI